MNKLAWFPGCEDSAVFCFPSYRHGDGGVGKELQLPPLILGGVLLIRSCRLVPVQQIYQEHITSSFLYGDCHGGDAVLLIFYLFNFFLQHRPASHRHRWPDQAVLRRRPVRLPRPARPPSSPASAPPPSDRPARLPRRRLARLQLPYLSTGPSGDSSWFLRAFNSCP